jgi:predicted MPP superfamily phosphohydrolase
MEKKVLRIAIISDLHCHPKRKPEEGKDETYLLTDKLRVPSKDHPVDDLLQKISKNIINKVDLTLCPGDFTDRANVQGFISGWGFSLEIHRALESKEIIATVGNHDVDVYAKHSNYTLEIAKGIKRGFPVEEEIAQDIFWSKGCVILERESYRILLINSAHFHYNKEAAKSGEVSDAMIEYVDDYLSKKNDNKIQIAMSHHHPIDHSRLDLGEEDKIHNADSLLNILGKYKFDLFIHGHKHDPLIRYQPITGYSYNLPIFGSGSFSSYSNFMYTGVKNVFHLVTLNKEKVCKGEIDTWTFLPKVGWTQPDDESAFPVHTGFGCNMDVESIGKKIVQLMSDKGKLNWGDLIVKIPDLPYLLPEQGKLLQELLSKNNLLIDKPIRVRPTEIYNVAKL